MKAFPSKDSCLHLCLLLLMFLLFPVLEYLQAIFIDPQGKYFLFSLFLGYPVTTLALAIRDGARNGFGWWWIVAPFVVFLIPMYACYNTSALIYGFFYSFFGVLGTLIGFLCWHYRGAVK